MPNQMPPTARMAGESVSTMIMSRPGVMPSLRTPMTWAVNGSGGVPLLTVYPVPVRPAVTWLTGTAAGHWAADAAWPSAGPASRASASRAATAAATTARRARGPGRGNGGEPTGASAWEVGGPRFGRSDGHGDPSRPARNAVRRRLRDTATDG